MSSFVDFYLSNQDLSEADFPAGIPFQRVANSSHDETILDLPSCTADFAMLKASSENGRVLLATPFGFFDIPNFGRVLTDDPSGKSEFVIPADLGFSWISLDGDVSPQYLKMQTNPDGSGHPLYRCMTNHRSDVPLTIQVFLPGSPSNVVADSFTGTVSFLCERNEFTINIGSFPEKRKDIHVFIPGPDGFFSSQDILFSLF